MVAEELNNAYVASNRSGLFTPANSQGLRNDPMLNAIRTRNVPEVQKLLTQVIADLMHGREEQHVPGI